VIKLLRRGNTWLSTEMGAWGSVVCAVAYAVLAIIALHRGYPVIAMIGIFWAGVTIAGPIDHAGKRWKARHDRR
jgi:hypothetical protein